MGACVISALSWLESQLFGCVSQAIYCTQLMEIPVLKYLGLVLLGQQGLGSVFVAALELWCTA